MPQSALVLRDIWRPDLSNYPPKVVLNIKIISNNHVIYECVSKSFRTGRLERELQMIQLPATRCSCIAILWVNLVSFAAKPFVLLLNECLLLLSIYFVIDSVRKLLDTSSCVCVCVYVYETNHRLK
jgi:hypothetical protein